MTEKIGVIFSDIDGTLCFAQEMYKIRRVKSNPDGTSLVVDKENGNIHRVYSLPPDNNVFLAVDTRKLAHQLKYYYDFIYVSGARQSTLKSRITYLDFADSIILENGGLILDSKLRINQDWYNHLEYERKYLVEIKKFLREAGWVIDKGRTSAIRIRQIDNPHKTNSDIENLYNNFALPSMLKKTFNVGNLDIILRSAGKENAVNYLMKLRNYTPAQSIGIGDDINDIEFLKLTNESCVLLSSLPEVLNIARQNGWYITKETCFDGINEILKKLNARR
jgi:hydroxymethylpyrimidine pyrophosphatase-like HAD family hydrolase